MDGNGLERQSDQLVSASEASEMLSYNRDYFNLLIRTNKLPGFPTPVVIGRRRRWWVSEIHSWLDAQRKEPVNG